MSESNQSEKSQSTAAAPPWLLAVGIIALLWNLMGCAAYLTEVFAQEWSMEQQEWTEEQKEWARSIPAWIYWIYAVAVFSGVAGSVCLIIRKKWAMPLFAVSMVTVIVQMSYAMIISGGLEIMGASAAIMPALVVTLSIVLLWFSFFATSKKWLTD